VVLGCCKFNGQHIVVTFCWEGIVLVRSGPPSLLYLSLHQHAEECRFVCFPDTMTPHGQE
jgi:hypothetical protein